MHTSPENHNHAKIEAETLTLSEDALYRHQEKQKVMHAEARRVVHETALTKEQFGKDEEIDIPHHHYITRHMRDHAFINIMQEIQQNLPKKQIIFSKFIHASAVEVTSDVLAKTIARPSGVIGGSGLAIALGLAVILLAHNIGFEVPNSLLPILFCIGFVLGILGELLVKTFRRRRVSHRAEDDHYH